MKKARLCGWIAGLGLVSLLAGYAAFAADAIDWDLARQLYQKSQRGETLTAEEQAYLNRAKAARAQGNQPPAAPALTPRETVGLTPLTDLGDRRYQGEDGGLYGGGRNEPPEAHRKAAERELARIQPLDADGKPAANGKIALVSIGMSNTTMEFSRFKSLADWDPQKSPSVEIVDGAQGGMAAAQWANAIKSAQGNQPAAAPAAGTADAIDWDRARQLNRRSQQGEALTADEQTCLARAKAALAQGNGPGGARENRRSPWDVLDERLKQAGVSAGQVQAVWLKQAEINPAQYGDFPAHARKLERNVVAALNELKRRFPNLRVAYLSSRIYAGYANGALNPEPYAYEGAFAMRWVIQSQIAGDAALNYDPDKGEVKAPLVLWGPYLWADGTAGRKTDALKYERADLGPDGTHPSDSGRQKVADLLLNFFKGDPLAKTWFVAAKANP